MDDSWKGKHYAFFQNRKCEYFPCHKTEAPEEFNCLFCYCPLYPRPDCGGRFVLLPGGIKDCGECLFPHQRDNYGAVLERLKRKS